jgi:hypothetical protein
MSHATGHTSHIKCVSKAAETYLQWERREQKSGCGGGKSTEEAAERGRSLAGGDGDGDEEGS